MIKFGNDIVTVGGDWLGFGSSPTPPPTPTIYRINVPTVEHGTVSVNPTEGLTGTLVTISTAPDTGYELDTISLTGATLINGNQFYIEHSDVTVNVSFKVNYNPLNLPPYTIRLKYNGTPTFDTTRVTSTVDRGNGVWDMTYYNTMWDSYYSAATAQDLFSHSGLVEVLGANIVGVTNIAYLFHDCTSLTKVALFDTSTIVTWMEAFVNCRALKEIPDFPVSSRLQALTRTFDSCHNVESGILNMYNKFSANQLTGWSHSRCFNECGKYTDTGNAERAQIPTDWKEYIP